MTKEEMDNYLESIGGLVNGYYLNKKPIVDSYYFSVDKGWFPLIKKLIDDLIELNWNKQVCQVKEKFGGLRFYVNGGSNEIHDRIVKAEIDSYSICEKTGKPGELRKDIGWFKTLCDDEYIKIKKEREIR
jgi:hypothetical protein